MEGWNLQWGCFRFFWGQMFGLVGGCSDHSSLKILLEGDIAPMWCGFFLFASVLESIKLNPIQPKKPESCVS